MFGVGDICILSFQILLMALLTSAFCLYTRMYVYEKRALKKCHHALLRDLVPNSTFLSHLERCKVVDAEQRIQISKGTTRSQRMTVLLQILPQQEDGCCLRFIHAIQNEYPWLSSHLLREFIKEKTSFTKQYNEGLSSVVNKQITPMVLGPEAKECKVPKTAKESLACVDAVSGLLDKMQTLSYSHLGVDPIEVCNMALCVVLEDKIVQYKQSIENLKEKITKLKVPWNNMRVLKQEIINEKEAAKYLEKDIRIKDSAISHLEYQNAVLKQRLETLKKSGIGGLCNICYSKCRRRHSSFSTFG